MISKRPSSLLIAALRITGRSLAVILLVLFTLVCISGVSPVYRFSRPEPFTGPDIFNPYAGLDTAHSWKRANFHTHTRVEGIFNECTHSPQATYDSLKGYGYDIVTFSNHNELTEHPFDSSLAVNVYEHGYNLFKYHKLVFGSDKVWHWDNILPLFTFQRQAQMDRLSRDSDLIQLNHPARTNGTSKKGMERLSGYDIMELDSGKTTSQEYWDWALSAGHYSFALANDDLHYPDRSRCIAVRCNFLDTPSARYEDLLATLREGCYYCMRIPDYGNGDWKTKHRLNAELPAVRDIGLKDGTVFLRLTETADSIRVTGQDHRTLFQVYGDDELAYAFRPEDSYARLTAWFPDGEVIYSNVFARYDSSLSALPGSTDTHSISVAGTLAYNLGLLILCIFAVMLTIRIKRKK